MAVSLIEAWVVEGLHHGRPCGRLLIFGRFFLPNAVLTDAVALVSSHADFGLCCPVRIHDLLRQPAERSLLRCSNRLVPGISTFNEHAQPIGIGAITITYFLTQIEENI